MIPSWQLSTLENIPHRRTVNLWWQNAKITLELIGETTVAIVLWHEKNSDLRVGEVVWIKEMMPDRITIKDLQRFSEGLPGAARGLDRVRLVEGAKAQKLERTAEELFGLLTTLEDAQKGDDAELNTLFTPYITFMELFHATNPADLEQMKREDVRKIRIMLRRCCTIEDKLGRRNPHSKVLGVKSSQQRLRSMSARRMAVANKAGVASITLTILMNAINALVAEVHTEITSKLKAKSWDHKNPKHMHWLKDFGNKLETWASEMGNVNMHPFAQGGGRAREHLITAASIIWRLTSPGAQQQITDNDTKSVMINSIKNELELLLKETRILLARFQLAELLRVVGVAKDHRVRELDIAITQPNWRRINSELKMVCVTFGIRRTPLHVPAPTKTQRGKALAAYYTELRTVARMHDEVVRSAV